MPTYQVYLTGKSRKVPVKVDAEYHIISDNGSLIFRIRQPAGYPLCVAAFAAGQWVEVALKQEK